MHIRAMNGLDSASRRILACLGDSSRFRIVMILQSGERFVSALAHEVGLSQSCTTRHLQALQKAGVVVGERQGKRVGFRLRIDDTRVRDLIRWVGAEAVSDVADLAASRPEAIPGPHTRATTDASPGREARQAHARRPGAGPPAEPAPVESHTENHVDSALPSEPSPGVPPEGGGNRGVSHPGPAPRRGADLEDFLL
jgi:DNA-binding transcriptional ArsR family regulator